MGIIILPVAQEDLLSVQELASVGIFEYQNVITSHHKLAYRRINGDVYVYALAGHRQDYMTLLAKRLFKI